MAVYQEKAKERIKAALRKQANLVTKAKEGKWQEADTRKIVLKTLTEVLGWDEFENITGEFAIKGQYADYVIQKDGVILAVIEIKQIGLKLNNKHLTQAQTYAVNEGVEWIFLTNGNDWRIYRIVFENKIPDAKLVFIVTIDDSSMRPAQKVDYLYLLSVEAFRKNELSAHYNRHVALSGVNLSSKILSVPVLDKLKSEIKKSTGHKVNDDELAALLIERVIREEAQPGNCDSIVKKLAKKPVKKQADRQE